MGASTPIKREPPVVRTTIRPDDEESIKDIVTSTGFFEPYEINVAVELVRERLDRGTESGYHFVLADVAGQTVAYACYGPIPCTVGSYDLYWIASHAAHRRRGLGRTLLREVERLVSAAGGRRLYVETSSRPLYEPTHRFYEACGYLAEARLEDFYTPGDAKIIYARALGC